MTTIQDVIDIIKAKTGYVTHSLIVCSCRSELVTPNIIELDGQGMCLKYLIESEGISTVKKWFIALNSADKEKDLEDREVVYNCEVSV